MPEWTDALVEHIYQTVKVPHELIVVDNGSDIVKPSKYTNYWIPKNVQMTRGFMQGVRFADSMDEDFFAYWLIITSVKFYKEYNGEDYTKVDPLELLLKVLVNDKLAYAVQPSFTFNEGSAWKNYLSPRTPPKPRRMFALEPLAVLYNAKHFNRLGRWNEDLTMGWGICAESFYNARKAGLHSYTHDGYIMHKESFIGYEMDRMNMTKQERINLSSKEVKEYFEPKYGKDYYEYLNYSYRETGTGEY